ncbi:glycosyltransferase [Echinicola marina]|uniref:glycosyltransferase family 2 protein n=1 Tax=Echinicola marina TaxID=2859768 RepID=UPI001CF6B825|nr:glycosyltransferase [Echinicola marina]UCS93963.1 glycosyltransferase [Echinicola marina]
MNNNPLVSVIMPCYNAGQYISKAIKSILTQSLGDFELLVIDDGSTDHTENLVRNISDIRIRYHRFEENRGNYVARNYGLDLAKGKYIAMADADDVSLPKRLQTQSDYLEANSEVMSVGTLTEVINRRGEIIGKLDRPLRYEEIKTALLRDCYLSQPTIMYRKSLIDDGYRYDENFLYAGDYDFAYRVAKKHPVANIGEYLVQYRLWPGHISVVRKKEQTLLANQLRERQLQELGMLFSEEEFSLHLKLLVGAYLEDHELPLAEKWLNRLLVCNSETGIYDMKYLQGFCQKLAEIMIKKNALGGWSIEKTMLKYLINEFSSVKAVLEFGSGTGTEALLKYFQVISLENNPHYLIKRGSNHTLQFAPIENGWYKRTVVIEAITSQDYGFILVDGPERHLREGILNHISAFSQVRCPIIFDDINRKKDLYIMQQFCRKLERKYKIIDGEKKSFAICVL